MTKTTVEDHPTLQAKPDALPGPLDTVRPFGPKGQPRRM